MLVCQFDLRRSQNFENLWNLDYLETLNRLDLNENAISDGMILKSYDCKKKSIKQED